MQVVNWIFCIILVRTYNFADSVINQFESGLVLPVRVHPLVVPAERGGWGVVVRVTISVVVWEESEATNWQRSVVHHVVMLACYAVLWRAILSWFTDRQLVLGRAGLTWHVYIPTCSWVDGAVVCVCVCVCGTAVCGWCSWMCGTSGCMLHCMLHAVAAQLAVCCTAGCMLHCGLHDALWAAWCTADCMMHGWLYDVELAV